MRHFIINEYEANEIVFYLAKNCPMWEVEKMVHNLRNLKEVSINPETETQKK